jgi:hypothetical protein
LQTQNGHVFFDNRLIRFDRSGACLFFENHYYYYNFRPPLQL